MSALTPHIRVLRAEAEALNHWANERHSASSATKSLEGLTVACLLFDLANAKTRAADKLEAEEADLAKPLEPNASDVTYQPKGKR